MRREKILILSRNMEMRFVDKLRVPALLSVIQNSGLMRDYALAGIFGRMTARRTKK